MNNAELGSGVIFSYCRAFMLFRKSITIFTDGYWSEFWMSDLSSEIAYVAKTNQK